MINDQQILSDLHSLPPEKQLKVLKLIRELKSETGHQHSQKHPIRRFGMMKGLVEYMADDFDEPLDDFSEYMS
ncbi:MAG: DUF2281 domain-containing protein [Candidatus Sericytochromatia bacterium]